MKTLLDQLRSNCVLIENSGTGFWITPHHVITCGHVLEQVGDKAHWNAMQLVGKGQRSFTLKLIKSFQPETDIAILHCEEQLENEVIPLASYCTLGQNLLGFAFQPHEKFGRQFMQPYIARAFWDQFTEILVLEGKIFQGYSGAPVYNPVTKAICGILWGQHTTQPESYALSVSTIESCIRQVLPDFQTQAVDPQIQATTPTDTSDTITPEQLKKSITEAENLIGNDELLECVDRLRQLPLSQSTKNDLITIRAKINSLEKSKSFGTLSFENQRLEENSIIQSLLMVIQNLNH